MGYPPYTPRAPLPHVPILARGEDWVIVAKPPRMVTHRNHINRELPAALQAVRNQVRRHVYPVHRLDYQTSGCLIFTTRRGRVAEIAEALRAGQKTYIALVRGYFKHEGEVLVDKDLKAEGGGEPLKARSRVRCLGRSHDPRCSLLEVHPETGRFHQVRRHVRDLQHPVVVDSAHGDSRINRYWRQRGLTRLGLHCLRLELEIDGEQREIVCPLFSDQQEVYATLPWWSEACSLRPELSAPSLPIPQEVTPLNPTKP